METTERIVESYARYVKGWFTLPNIRCDGQFEIDLLAIDPLTNDRYHIESGVSVSGAYSKLTDRAFSPDSLKIRVQQAGQRRTLGYFTEREFSSPQVLSTLEKYGFLGSNYRKVIATWGWQDGLEEKARAVGVELWDFRDLIEEIARLCVQKRSYFGDDTLRTLHLFALAKTVKR